MYLKGDGVTKDLTNAADIRWKACDKSNNASICIKFGGLFFDGKDVAKDKAEALRYYDRACELNDRLGICVTANSLRIDFERVNEWSKDCAARDATACMLLGKSYYDGRNDVLDRDIEQAVKFLNRACAAGEGGGCDILSDIYIHKQIYSGWMNRVEYPGIKQDEQLSVSYKQLACDLGSEYLCEWLEKNQGDVVGRLTRDANLIYYNSLRIPPHLSRDIKTSGYCDLIFDVLADGTPSNIKPQYCTHPSLATTIAESIETWLFTPRFVNGKPALQKAKSQRMAFTVRDADGNEVPFVK